MRSQVQNSQFRAQGSMPTKYTKKHEKHECRSWPKPFIQRWIFGSSIRCPLLNFQCSAFESFIRCWALDVRCWTFGSAIRCSALTKFLVRSDWPLFRPEASLVSVRPVALSAFRLSTLNLSLPGCLFLLIESLQCLIEAF